MKINIILILTLTLMIIPGCSNDEPDPPVSNPAPVTTPPNTPIEPVITPPDTTIVPETTPPKIQDPPPIITTTEITPPISDANELSVSNQNKMPDYSQHPYNPQEVIAGAVNIFSFSLANFDKEKYLSVLHGDELMTKAAIATFDYLATFKDYENAYIATYGLETWKNFAPNSTSIDTETLRKNLATMKIMQTGDQAVCHLPGSNQPPFHTIRIDKLWYINLSLMFPFDPQQFIDQYSKIIALHQDMLSKIGNPEYNPGKLNTEFEIRLTEIMKEN